MVFFYFTALLAVLGQGPGNGISKDTRACSEGVIQSTYDFMLKYFPVTEAQDDCDNHGQCECGSQARFTLNTGDIPSPSPGPGPPGGNSGFGLHCVYAAGKDDVRKAQSGNKTQEEIEAVFQDRFNGMTDYDAFMEYNVGLYTSDISTFATSLKNGGVPFVTIHWNDTTGNYVSVLVNPPKTTVVYEIVGESASASADLLGSALASGPRFQFDEKPTADSDTFTPVWISRATTDVSRDKNFMNLAFGSTDGFKTTDYSGTGPDGKSMKMLTVQLSSTATVKLRLVQPNDPNDGEYSVSWWETYLNDVHAKYMTSIHCGWDLMGDNHNAYDWRGGIDMGNIVKGAAQAGYTYFCKSVTRPFPGTHCYMNTPYGYQMQLDGDYSDPPSGLGTYTSDLCATYMEYC